MKDILTAPFVKEMCDTTANMYRLGWDERNGGNISYMLDEEEIAQYLDINHVLREIPTGFKADALIGRIFIVTGTGKYFKNVKTDPENNLGIIRIAEDGTTAQLLWGYKDGGKFTSELPAHLMSHMARLSVDKDNRVVIHSHPTNTLAMNYVHELDEKKFTHTLWEMCTECIVVFPDGVGILPWMLCGTNEIGEATAEKMKEFRLVIWAMHGIYGAGKTLDETFGLIETVEKAAQAIFTGCGFFAVLAVASITLYMIISGTPALFKVGILEIIFGTAWQPAAASPSFGILFVILTSIVGTFLAILIGVPIGVMTAIFLAEVAPKKPGGHGPSGSGAAGRHPLGHLRPVGNINTESPDV